METPDFSDAQYDEIRVEVNYRRFYTDGKDHWQPALGWKSIERARAASPDCEFREVVPPVSISEKCPACGQGIAVDLTKLWNQRYAASEND
jgi:hypothetical protein